MIESYGPGERIRTKKDFINLYRSGLCFRGKYFNLIYLSNNLGHCRMAVVASKKIGNAAKRSRVRRRARELFRRNKDLLTFSADMILIAKKDIQNATWQELREQYLSTVKAIQIKN
jgi:ribonuclease P protein component